MGLATYRIPFFFFFYLQEELPVTYIKFSLEVQGGPAGLHVYRLACFIVSHTLHDHCEFSVLTD